MVHFIQEQPKRPSWGQVLGGAAGQGLQQGISQGAQYATKLAAESKANKANQFKQLAKEKAGLLPKFNQYTNTFIDPKKAFDPQVKNEVYKRAQQFLDSGEVTPEEAIALSWNDYNKMSEQTNGQTPKKSVWDMLGLSKNEQEKHTNDFFSTLKNLPENIYGGVAKFGGGLAQAAQFPFHVIGGLGQAGRKGVYKALGLSPEEIAQREQKLYADTLAGEKATGVINPFVGTSIPQALSNITDGRSEPQTETQRVIQSAIPFGIQGIAAYEAEKIASDLGLPEAAQEFLGISAFILAGHGKIPSKIGSAARKMVTKAEKVGAKSAVPSEVILKQAEVASGVDMNKVNAGEGREIKKFNNALNAIEKNVDSSFKVTEKFDKAKAWENRKETMIKLEQSPLSEYYEPKIKEPVTEAGKASKAMREAPVKERIESIKAEIKQPSFHEVSPIERQAKLHELKEAEFELRNGKKPVTHEQLMEQIETQHSAMREYIENPNAKKIGEIKRQLGLDQKAIKRAEQLSARGELPGPKVMDEFMKIHHEYVKGYEQLHKQLADFIDKHEGIKGKNPQVSRAKELQDLTNHMKKVSQSKLVNQIDKRKALSALEKPSGTFYKNYLKQLGDDVAAFEKQFFKVNRALSPESMKAKKIGQRNISEMGKTKETASSLDNKKAESVAKNTAEAMKEPTSENIKKLADETGMPEEKLGDILQETRSEVKEVVKNPTDKKIDSFSKKLVNKFKILSKKLMVGAISGTIQSLIEEGTGLKLNLGIINTGLYPILGKKTAVMSYVISSQIRNFFEKEHANDLKKVRNHPKEFHAEVTRLKNKYGDTKTNRILKKMKESS